MPAVPDNGPYPKPFGQGYYPDDAPRVPPEERYRNALVWIRHVAGLHYFGGAFDPEHMRDLANMAAAALQGKDFPDYVESMARGREKAAEWAALFATLAEDLDAEVTEPREGGE